MATMYTLYTYSYLSSLPAISFKSKSLATTVFIHSCTIVTDTYIHTLYIHVLVCICVIMTCACTLQNNYIFYWFVVLHLALRCPHVKIDNACSTVLCQYR